MLSGHRSAVAISSPWTAVFIQHQEASLIVPDFTISVYGNPCHYIFYGFNLAPLLHLSIPWPPIIGEGWREKQRQRSSRLFGGRMYSIPCRAICFALVDLWETVEEIEQILPPKYTRKPFHWLLSPYFLILCILSTSSCLEDLAKYKERESKGASLKPKKWELHELPCIEIETSATNKLVSDIE